MQRKLTDFISINGLRHLIYIPKMLFGVKNFGAFISNYLGFSNTEEEYELRNPPLKIIASAGVDAATIAVIFFKNDYGAIPQGATIIDIGANIGVFSLYAASQGKKILAFEPMPETYERLVENIKLNNLGSKIIPFQMGVSGNTGKRDLMIAAEGSPFHSLVDVDEHKKTSSIQISCISMDDIFAQNSLDACDLLKIDCEGAEFEILYNTSRHTMDRIRLIRLEYHNQNDKDLHVDSLTQFLRERGYRIDRFRKDNNYSGSVWFSRS